MYKCKNQRCSFLTVFILWERYLLRLIMGVNHNFEKMKPQQCFFFFKPILLLHNLSLCSNIMQCNKLITTTASSLMDTNYHAYFSYKLTIDINNLYIDQL